MSRCPRPLRSGVSLIELVASMAISSILLLAIASTMVVTTKAIPASTDCFTAPLTAAQAVDQMAGELESALLVLEQTSTSITFTVPPRNGDTMPEKIRYSWAGNGSSPLTRQYNNGKTANFVTTVSSFSLTPTVATSTESYPAVATEDATDSLLIDYSSTSGAANQNVNSSTYQGQYFASNSWPAGVVGWRPTRIQFQGKQSSLLGSTNIEMALPLTNFTPSTPYAEQYTSLGTGLLASYGWQQFSFSTIDRLAPSAGICLLLQGVLGLPNSMTVESNNLSSLLQTTNSGSTWNYVSNKAMVSQLYGKLSRSGSTQYATTKYLTALTINLRAGATTNPMVTTTAQLMNTPAMLTAYWELKFDKNPTTVDSNSDGAADWVPSSGTFNASSVSGGVWQANGASLSSNPGDNFTKLTLIDLRLSAGSSGSWAGFSMNAARSSTGCAPILARVTQQSDGGQTVQVWRKLNDSTTDTLLLIPNLPSGAVDLHLIVDPTYGSVGIRVNQVEYGSFAYNSYNSNDQTTTVKLTSSGIAQFSYVRIQELQ